MDKIVRVGVTFPPELLKELDETIEEMGLKDIPAVSIVADVCRDDLLFEIDATVLI